MSSERAILALVAAVMLAIPWVQAVAKVFPSGFQTDSTSHTLRLTVATAVVMAALGLWRKWFTRRLMLAAASLATSVVAVLALAWHGGGFSADMFALPVVCPLAAWAATYMGKLLPRSMDGEARQRPTLSFLWCIVAGLAMVQSARLATYMSDPSVGWWITVEDPFWSGHMCLTAYVYGAELNRSGIENVYDPRHYPGLTPDAEAKTSIDNFTPDDPFQYPPPFLVLPRLALALSNDFLTIRTFWFALQTTAFAILAIALAGWVDGASGRWAAFLLPLCWLSIPVLTTFQYGQFHLAAVMLGVSAMLAFEKRHDGTGGALLAAAILSKMFPAVLLIPLIIRRRWQPVAWTAGFVVAFSLAAFR